MLKIGVLGAGHLGKIHLKCIQFTTGVYELVGFFDTNMQVAAQVAQQYQVKAFDRVEDLIDAVDVVDIVTPTTTHFELAKLAITKGKHVFIEKPITHDPQEAKHLLSLAQTHGVKVQVGHVERFNPAFLALSQTPITPKFIEAHRLSCFNKRGVDVSVVLDLMIHDLDIILCMVDSPVSKVESTGVSLVSGGEDIANVRLEFENGAIANIMASRVATQNIRKMQVFQKDSSIEIDFLNKRTEIVRFHKELPQEEDSHEIIALNLDSGPQYMEVALPPVQPVNAIQLELELLAQAIQRDIAPRVTIEDGIRVLELAHRILDKIASRNDRIY